MPPFGWVCWLGVCCSGFGLPLGSYLSLLPAQGDLCILCTHSPLDPCKKKYAEHSAFDKCHQFDAPVWIHLLPPNQGGSGTVEAEDFTRSYARTCRLCCGADMSLICLVSVALWFGFFGGFVVFWVWFCCSLRSGSFPRTPQVNSIR